MKPSFSKPRWTAGTSSACTRLVPASPRIPFSLTEDAVGKATKWAVPWQWKAIATVPVSFRFGARSSNGPWPVGVFSERFEFQVGTFALAALRTAMTRLQLALPPDLATRDVL